MPGGNSPDGSFSRSNRIWRLGRTAALAGIIATFAGGCRPPNVLPSSIGMAKRLLYAHDLADHEEPKGKAWTAPTCSLPQNYVKAVSFLQSHGLGDPRAGVFSRVRYHGIAPDGTEPGKEVNGFGWVITGRDGKKRLLALDGLTRSTLLWDSPVRFDELRPNDLRLALGANDPAWGVPPRPDRYASSRPPGFPKGIAGALFLIAGHPELTEKILGPAQSLPPEPLSSMALTLLRTKWARAVGNHQRGQEEGAIRLATELTKLRPEYAQMASAETSSSWFLPSLDFLDQAPELIRDARRRLAEKPSSSRGQAGEEVTQLQDICNPGFNSPGQSGAFTVPDHNDNVLADRLISCIASDKRLTRSPEFGPLGLRVKSVAESASELFQYLTYLGLKQPDGVVASLPEMQTWWRANRDLKPSERVFRFLLDDHAGVLAWTKSAGVISGSMPQVEDHRTEMRLLISHVGPSVSDLIGRRAQEVSLDTSHDQVTKELGCDPAILLAMSLFKWDRRASVSIMRDVSERFYLEFKNGRPLSWSTKNGTLDLYSHRIEAGDMSADPHFQELQRWMNTRIFVRPLTLSQ